MIFTIKNPVKILKFFHKYNKIIVTFETKEKRVGKKGLTCRKLFLILTQNDRFFTKEVLKYRSKELKK